MPFFPVVLEAAGFTPSQIGLIFSLSSIVSGFFAYYSGKLSDRWGRLKMLLGATALASLSFLILAVISDPLLKVAAYLLLMIGFGASNTTVTAYSVDVLTHAGLSRGRGFGIIRIGGSIGWVPGSLLGGTIVSLFGINNTFFVSSMLIGLAFLTCVRLREVGRAMREGRELSSDLTLLKGAAGVLILVMALSFIANSSLVNFLSLHMINSLVASPLEVSIAFALMGLSEIPAMIYLGSLSDRVGRRPILLLCLAAIPIRLAITGVSADTSVVILAQALNSLTFGGLFVVSIAYASDLIPERARGAYMGLHGATFSFGGVIGGYLWGALAEALGYPAMFLYAALFSTLPLVLTGAMVKTPRRELCPAPEAS